jgi:hypothetical protein
VSFTCIGFLVMFSCKVPPPPVLSDFCDIMRKEVYKLRSLTKEEVAALKRPRKEAIRNLRKSFQKNCSE